MRALTRADTTSGARTQKRLTTGVTVDCPCGATDVPMAWGKGHNGSVHLYRHVKGVPWRGKAARGEKCGGPRDLFTYLLCEHKLLLVDRGTRAPTRAERVAASEGDHGQGALF